MMNIVYLPSHIWQQNALNSCFNTNLDSRYCFYSLGGGFSSNACSALDLGGLNV